MDTNTDPRLREARTPSTRPPAGQPARPATQADAAPPDLGAMIRRVFAHWPVVLLTMALGAAVTFQVVTTRKATYKSETVIFYREGIAKSVAGPTESPESVRALGTKLKETLLAQQTLRGLIDEFQLYPELVQKNGYADAVEQMRKKTEFKSRSSDTFAISFEGYDQAEAQKVCARMADLLVAETAKRLSEESKSTTEFLDYEKRRADEELDRLEREISQFLQAHPEFSTSKEGLGSESQALRQKDEEERKTRLRALGARGKAQRSREPAAPAASVAAAAAAERAPAIDPVLLATRAQAQSDLNAARKELSDKSIHFTDQHPDVHTASERVAIAEAALSRANEAIAVAQAKEAAAPPKRAVPDDDPYAEPAKPTAATPAPATPAPATPAGAPDLEREDREKARPKAADAGQNEQIVTLEVEWSRLTRSLALARSHQADLEGKLYRASMVATTAESGYGHAIAVLDPAYRPGGPSNAPPRTVAMIGLAASILVGFVLSAVWGLFLDDRLFAASEVEPSVMVPVLGVVPKARRKSKGDPRAGQGPSRA